MVNWHDPVVLLKDYIAFMKLGHAITGIYLWELVFTVGFELDVLRRKRPYRWTIWLYLGTRYTGLLGFISLLVSLDGPRVPCQFTIANFAFPYASWSFASFIIVLRVIAIWDRNRIVSLISIGVWLGALSLNIRHVALISAAYDPIVKTCVTLHTRRGLPNAIGLLVVDVFLLLTMLIGLLRHAPRSSTGIWKLLYQQCIIWIALALIAETPVVVMLILDLNDAWNEMFIVPAIAILSIGAARMYRSLCDQASLTEYMSSHWHHPQFEPKPSNHTAQYSGANISGPMHFASVTQSAARTTYYEAPVFLQLAADQIHVDFVPEGSDPSLAQVKTKDKTTSAGYEAV